jgi:AcrR family transcriptional regulator
MWAAVETDELQLVQPARGFVDQWTRLVAPQLGVEDSSVLPFAVLSICSHVWERHLAGGWGCDDNALRDILATVAHRAIVARAGTATSTAEPLPRPADSDWPGVRRPVGPRAHASLSRMAQSAAFLIARHGVAGTTMAGVAEHARVRPASLYTYWTDKTHLLATLSARVAPTLDRLLAEAEELRPTAPELSRWVARAATLDDEALAVLRWWQEGVPVQPATEQARRQRDEITARAGTAVDRMLELSHGPALAMSPELLLVLWCTLDFSRTAGHLLGPDRTADVVAAITRFLSGAFRAAGGTLRGVVPLP